MGIWAEIKHAINDTLGTTSFTPLNKIVTAAETAIKNYVSAAATQLESDVETHVTNQATAIKNLVTSETTGVETHVTSQATGVKNHVTTAFEDNVTFVASNADVYAVFPDELMYNSALITSDVCTITLPHNGSFTLKYRFGHKSNTGDTTKYVTFNIVKNGTATVFTTSTGTIISSAADAVVTLSGKKGDVFKLSVVSTTNTSGTGNAYLYLYSILATPLYGKSMTITAL